MAKSKAAIEGQQASIKAITMMGEYDTPDAPTPTELDEVAAVLDIANTKYHEAELATSGEIDPDEFLKVVQNFASVLLDLRNFDNALDALDKALQVPSLKAAKEAELNGLILTLAFDKANAITGVDGDQNEIIAAADIGLAIDPADENLHYLKGLAHLKKGEETEAIAEFVYLKGSTTVELRDYANNTAKSLLTKLAIEEIEGGETFQNFITGKNIGIEAEDWMTRAELAGRIASFARFKYAPTVEQEDAGALVNKPLGCILMNAVIGEHAGAQDTLHTMATGGKAGSTLLGNITDATDPIVTDFSALTWT